MKIFEGKSPAERNKIIAASVLGVLAILALGYTFKGMFFPTKKTTINVKVSPSPTPTIQNASQNPNLPSQQQMDFEYTTVPVVYNPGNFNAPDPGRNIFAFYEPGKPTPYSPTPTPIPTPFPTPTATPLPPIMVSFVNPASVYAGSKGFSLQISGDKFTPDSVILFNGSQLPTTYIGPQNISTQISDGLIAFPGIRNISVITPDGKYSNTVSMNVQEPPKPTFKYIGMIARKRYNNDTAYFEEPGKETPIGARLNDVVAGRFRLKSISAEEVVFEDVSLGFKHKLALNRPSPGQTSSTLPGNPRGNNTFQTNVPQPYVPPQGSIPGIPDNYPRYNPTPQNVPNQDDVDDDDDGNNNEKKP
jgi:hypothetical protein